MYCAQCQHWTTTRKTLYDDGSEIIISEHVDGKGDCGLLGIATLPVFGCSGFEQALHDAAAGFSVSLERKSGSPWHHWVMGACPDCAGAGSRGGGCHRCAGTGNVRHYDDGFVGEERTRKHPKESEKPQLVDPGTVLATKQDKHILGGES